MKIKLKDNSILDVIRIVGENIFSTTFEKTDRNDITINNKEIVKIQFNDGIIFEIDKKLSTGTETSIK